MIRPTSILFGLCALLAGLAISPAHAGAKKRLLVVTVTKGFRHDTIPTAERVIGELAEQGRYTVDYARTDEDLTRKMSGEGLKVYDGVAFASTTGDLPLPSPQAFLDWVRAGHSFIGIHAASDTFHGFTPYLEMLGGEFEEHIEAGVTVQVADRKFPGLKELSAIDIPREEIYQFKNFESDDIHLLLYLDQHPGSHLPALCPLSWCRGYGKGRVFYTAFGHREDVWESPWFQDHLQGGIEWALKLAKGDDKPHPLPIIPGTATAR